jgi:hypothetical protein
VYRLTILLLLTIVSIFNVHSQTQEATAEHNPTAFGISAQVYPAGIIATINVDKFISEKTSLMFRAGVNLIERQDFSEVNDHEDGFGIGASVGYRKHFPLKKGQILAAFNTDVWNEWIDWENDMSPIDETSGTTYTLVLQPWLETGYFTGVNKSSLQYGLTAGFGREINVITDGREVAQGWILSLLLHFQYIFPHH